MEVTSKEATNETHILQKEFPCY